MVTIAEEFDILLQKAAQITDPFEQSFFLLVHIPYLQAFADVNKRTSRVASNILLLKSDLAPMSFMAMDDSDYIDGLYELNNVALLREVYRDAYLASAEKYRILGAKVKSPEKAAVSYREFTRAAVRRCVPEFKEFRIDAVDEMAWAAGVADADRADVVAYVREQIAGLHEGNVIRYRLKPDDLEGVKLCSGRYSEIHEKSPQPVYANQPFRLRLTTPHSTSICAASSFRQGI